MNLYDVNQTEDFNGTNGLELSIRKWESIVEALGERLSEDDRLSIEDLAGKHCGLCMQHEICGIDCLLGKETKDCGPLWYDALDELELYRHNTKKKAPALTAAKAMLAKLESLQND